MASQKTRSANAGDVIRRTTGNDRAAENEVLPAALADELEHSVRGTRNALRAARADIRQTLRQLAARLKPKSD